MAELNVIQVPEDIQSVLGDKEIFNNMPEVTTKEILKRYGEIAKTPEHHAGGVRPEMVETQTSRPSEMNGNNTRPGAPLITRVDTDPSQLNAWQKESSVRHVQGIGPSYPPTNHNTPPQLQSEFANRNSPYHFRGGSGDSVHSHGTPNRHSHRPSQMGRQGADGHMGTAGAT